MAPMLRGVPTNLKISWLRALYLYGKSKLIDENGNVRHLRNEEVVFEIELQKETAELGMIEKSEVEAAAKELNIKEQKNEKETRVAAKR